MKSELHHRILETIRRHHMIVAGDRVGVAVSGGADSVALLRLLEDLQIELGVGLCVLHLNHGLRGEDSEADAIFIADFARARRLEFFSTRVDVAAEAKRDHRNLEDAGRRARYDFFERAVSEGHCTKVGVAHTADDQAETVLARILRGTGPRGMVGILPGAIQCRAAAARRAPSRSPRIYLAKKGEQWREDATNLDTTRLRARLRHELLPQLEHDFNPAIVERLSSLSTIFRDEEAFWNLLVEDRVRALANETRAAFRLMWPTSSRRRGGRRRTQMLRVRSHDESFKDCSPKLRATPRACISGTSRTFCILRARRRAAVAWNYRTA